MELPTSIRPRARSLPLALAAIGVLTLVGCAADARKEGATVAPPATARVTAPAPASTTARTDAAGWETTTDRGDRLERPRPVGALAPESEPRLP